MSFDNHITTICYETSQKVCFIEGNELYDHGEKVDFSQITNDLQPNHCPLVWILPGTGVKNCTSNLNQNALKIFTEIKHERLKVYLFLSWWLNITLLLKLWKIFLHSQKMVTTTCKFIIQKKKKKKKKW